MFQHLLNVVQTQYQQPLTEPEDIQALRLAVETAKLQLTYHDSADITLTFSSITDQTNQPVRFQYTLTRRTFEHLNMDLFKKVLEPVQLVLKSLEMGPEDVDEVVLVGGSTRIPKIRQLIEEYFRKVPNTHIDPELAVVYGVSIQAGILGGMWPLTVSAIELPTRARKIHVS